MSSSSPRLTRTIALMNQKGGVGKTTTTVNLAASFARAGRPTLIIDLDPQAHASLHVGVDPASCERTVYDVLLDDDAASAAAAVKQAGDNLYVIPSTTDLAAAESELTNVSNRTRRLEAAIAALGDRFEFVLIDCPPSLGLLTINALTAAREVVIPMQAHFLALQGVSKLLETVRMIAAQTNPRLRVTGVALCMHDNSSSHTKEVVADLEAFFDAGRDQNTPWKFARVLRPAIRRNIKLAECPSFGQTIFDYAPDAPGSSDYAALGGALLKEWDAMLAKRGGATPNTAPTATPPPAASPTPVVTVTAPGSQHTQIGSSTNTGSVS
jgi:chromosome partitioning protein